MQFQQFASTTRTFKTGTFSISLFFFYCMLMNEWHHPYEILSSYLFYVNFSESQWKRLEHIVGSLLPFVLSNFWFASSLDTVGLLLCDTMNISRYVGMMLYSMFGLALVRACFKARSMPKQQIVDVDSTSVWALHVPIQTRFYTPILIVKCLLCFGQGYILNQCLYGW